MTNLEWHAKVLTDDIPLDSKLTLQDTLCWVNSTGEHKLEFGTINVLSFSQAENKIYISTDETDVEIVGEIYELYESLGKLVFSSSNNGELNQESDEHEFNQESDEHELNQESDEHELKDHEFNEAQLAELQRLESLLK